MCDWEQIKKAIDEMWATQPILRKPRPDDPPLAPPGELAPWIDFDKRTLH